MSQWPIPAEDRRYQSVTNFGLVFDCRDKEGNLIRHEAQAVYYWGLVSDVPVNNFRLHVSIHFRIYP